MIETLYVNGCSWTSGNELEFDPSFEEYLAEKGLHRSPENHWNIVDSNDNFVDRVNRHWDKFNWPGKLAAKLSIPTLVNQSIGGGSNARMARQTMEYVLRYPEADRNKLFVIVAWTISDRNEIYLDNKKGVADWVQFNSNQPLVESTHRRFELSNDSNLSKSITEYQKQFILSIETEYSHIHRYMYNVFTLANLLENLKVKYFFFNALPPWWPAGAGKCRIDAEHLFEAEINWQATKPQILNYRKSMYDFVEQRDFPRAPCYHPLVPAHEAWSDYLVSVIKERNILE
jgi:hypothetical protein